MYPPLVWVSAYAYSEAVFWPFGLLVVWSVDRLTPEPRATSGTGVRKRRLTGAGVLLRAALTTFLPLGDPVDRLPARATARDPVRARSRRRDHAVGDPQLRSSWTIRHRRVGRRRDVLDRQQSTRHWRRRHGRQSRLKEANSALRARHPNLNEEQMEPVYYREALSWIRANPGGVARARGRRSSSTSSCRSVRRTRCTRRGTWSHPSCRTARSSSLALAGFHRLGTARARTPGLWLLFASAVAVALVFFPQERFRIPVIDPTLIVCAAALWKDGTDDNRGRAH